MLRHPGLAGNQERRKQPDLRAPPSATPPPPTGDPDFQPRHIECRTRMLLRSASPAEALPQPQALAGSSRTPDPPPSCSSQSRVAVGRQRISGPHSRHDELNSDTGIGRPAKPGCFAVDRARPSHSDSARAPAGQPAAAVSAAACFRGVAPMHGQQRGPR